MLDADPLEVVSGDLDHKPELPILLDLLAEAEEAAGAATLRRWVRAAGPAGTPIDLLLTRDFAGFENALATLSGARLRDQSSSGSGRFSPGHVPVRWRQPIAP